MGYGSRREFFLKVLPLQLLCNADQRFWWHSTPFAEGQHDMPLHSITVTEPFSIKPPPQPVLANIILQSDRLLSRFFYDDSLVAPTQLHTFTCSANYCLNPSNIGISHLLGLEWACLDEPNDHRAHHNPENHSDCHRNPQKKWIEWIRRGIIADNSNTNQCI